MNHIRNNTGSTLLLALAMITIFSILFITLSIGSLNNSKQIHLSESDIQATSLAEMGVVHQRAYIMTEIINIASNQSIMQEITDNFIDIFGYIEPDDENMASLTNEYLKMVLDKWTNELSSLNNISKTIATNNQYEIENYTVSHDQENLIVQFISKGNNAKEEVSLRTNIVIPIKSSVAFDIEYREGDGGGGTEGGSGDGNGFPTGNDIEEPTNLSTCSGNFLNGGQCQIDGSYVLGNGNNEFNNATVKITGALNVNGNLNNSSNSTIWIDGSFTTSTFNNGNGIKLHVGGSANFNSNLNNLENSIFEILGSATFSNVQNAKNSIIYIGGQANFNGHLDLEDGSIAYINGNATFSNKLNVTTNSKLCVNGHLTVNGNISGSNIFAKSSNKSNVNTDSDDFEANCTSGGTVPSDVTQLYPYLKLNNDGSYDLEQLLDSTIDYKY